MSLILKLRNYTQNLWQLHAFYKPMENIYKLHYQNNYFIITLQ